MCYNINERVKTQSLKTIFATLLKSESFMQGCLYITPIM